jgi:inhibitor of cysteine peptidase
MMKKTIFAVFLIAVMAVLAIGCVQPGTEYGTGNEPGADAGNNGKKSNTKTPDVTINLAAGDIKKFSSEQELLDFLEQNSKNLGNGNYGYGMLGDFAARSAAPMAMAEGAVMSKAAMPESADSSVSGGGASDYSSTNVQIEGIDEADFVKNDGKYIYMITQNKLVIVDAYPAENAKIVSTTKLDGYARNMLVKEDKLVIFVDGNEQSYGISRYDFMPRPTYRQVTHVYVYDISDRANPEIVKDYNMKGYYYESRMIGDRVYFITSENVHYDGGPIMPLIKEGASIVARPEIYYFDNPEYGYNFNTVASFDLSDDSSDSGINAKTFMMGYSNTLFVSEDNIYIAYQKSFPYRYYRENNEERFFDAIVPLLPQDAQDKINGAKSETDETKRWERISSVIEELYNSMDDKEKQDFADEMYLAVEGYEAKLAVDMAKTVIHRISITDGEIEYGAKGEVPGHLLNQFSMDEHEGNLRIATTTQIWARESVMYNNVFVLNSGMETIGKLEALAPDERIYSARFIGDRLYMVTFKNIDPLFVIDMSDPENPEVLGELKIPGFSNYLHPYDEDHIIGIGKDTEANEWGGVSTNGVKLALFDVSDVKNPKQVSQYKIGAAGSDSEALNDHKAFLFDKEKNLLVLPVSEVKSKMEFDSRLGYYRQNVWQGAYAFRLTADEGFELMGKVTHENKAESSDWYWYNYEKAVRRSLFMDDVLYTVSMQRIKANSLTDMDEIKEIKLPYEKEMYDSYPYPMTIDTVAVRSSPGSAGAEPVMAE